MNLLIGMAILAILLYFFRHRIIEMSPKEHNRMMKRSHRSQSDLVKKSGRYHSVSISTPKHCCRQAGNLKAKRFLSDEAPPIPLGNCSIANCKCKYVHHADRRDLSENRRVDFGIAHDLYGAFGEENKRHLIRGRRSSDMVAAG